MGGRKEKEGRNGRRKRRMRADDDVVLALRREVSVLSCPAATDRMKKCNTVSKPHRK
jgi:hypothetical protein